MELSTFFDLLIGGVILGLLYSLIGSGLNLQYGVTRILNVAHGDFLMVGAYITYFFFVFFGVDPLLSLVISGLIAFSLGLLIQLGVFRGLIGEAVSPGEVEVRSLLACFALSFMIQNIVSIIFKSDPKSYQYATGAVGILGTAFPINRIIVACISFLVNLAIYLFLRFTRVGIAMRAVVEEPIGARLTGINPAKIQMLSLSLGILLAAWAGTLASLLYSINPYMGSQYTLIAMTIIVVGGFGSFLGSIVGGIILGYVSYSVMRLFSSSLTFVAFYAILVIILLFKPKGLMKR
ncbi:MAG: branched-chain amino acid ABC transporter permease [Candidatus Bathyarchaeia archaeon]